MTSERASFTKAEREYIKGIDLNLTFQRLVSSMATRREADRPGWKHDF